MLKKINIIFYLLISSFAFSQSIQSTVDSTQIKIGSQFNLTIKANVSKNDKVVFPESPFFGQLEVLESYPVDSIKNNDKLELIKKYGLTQFDSGRYVIPPLQVIINNKTTRTDSFAIVVNNVVVDTTKQQMYDIKSIIHVDKPTDYFWLYVIFGIILILAIGYIAYLLIKKKQVKKNEEEAILYASPIEKALAQLQSLEGKELWQKGETKAYYSELTDITRYYLEEAVEIPAMESTSNELFETLKNTVKRRKIKLSQDILDKFKRVMSNADLVKFAKSKPLDFEIENDKKMVDAFLMSLDKAIPRTEEETENLFTEELKRKKEHSQKLKRLFIPISLVLFLLLLGAVFIGITKGTDYVRENWLGHNAKSLLNEEWVTSEYGDPAIIISTPKVLNRINDERIQNNLPSHVKAIANFTYGSLLDNFSIALATTAFKDTTSVDLDRIVEVKLKQMELLGAKNITVKNEDYEDAKGLTGKKAYGTFTAMNLIEKEDQQMNYEVLVFSQPGGSQELLLIYKNDDEYAQQIMERVINSVELRKTTEK
ncbi:BatD family protein [Flavobacterium sediminilitoris]|uniref:BatD family protein n=1 Tax=Flavobacterium sediminilitoris TaxID=2024526 RepID=A0ABY4HQ96_9FLAO|nr:MULTISPECIES: BatD family protein [Flavobacterium]UOX34806.1 BatD family protein [Flavobacterium sediminilitoris]